MCMCMYMCFLEIAVGEGDRVGRRAAAAVQRLLAAAAAASAAAAIPEEGDEGDEEGEAPRENLGEARPRDEAADDKRARKAAAKADKAARRAEKKETKLAFKTERSRQVETQQRTAQVPATSLSGDMAVRAR